MKAGAMGEMRGRVAIGRVGRTAGKEGMVDERLRCERVGDGGD